LLLRRWKICPGSSGLTMNMWGTCGISFWIESDIPLRIPEK
jgi:hypothetical protein